jgi:hypothetical protein
MPAITRSLPIFDNHLGLRAVFDALRLAAEIREISSRSGSGKARPS